MHILLNNAHFGPLQPGEKQFLECWFNLTHAQSLDSFRLRCHNGRTILEELKREMDLPFASTEDLAPLVAEAKALCAADTTLQGILGPSWPPLSAALDQLAAKNPKDESTKDRSQIQAVLLDTLPSLPEPYIQKLFTELKQAIAANQDPIILRLANCLATDLAARGWVIASLHHWIETMFLSEANAAVPFNDRFDRFENRLKRPPEPYQVVLSLSGSRQVETLGRFGDFQFSSTPPQVQTTPGKDATALPKFLIKNKQRIFATTTVQAVDSHSAISLAQESFSKCQDRLRFNFCTEPVVSWTAVLVIRPSDAKHTIINASWPIPNPEHHLDLKRFLVANERIDKLFASGQLTEESRRRIEAAVRHYRLGLDARGYRDLLLNCWTGLEILASAGDGKGIGPKVLKNAVPILIHRYFTSQLQFLANPARLACGEWPPEAQKVLEAMPKTAQQWQRILALLQDPTASAVVANGSAAHPWLSRTWSNFTNLATDPAKLAACLDEHEERVRWHLLRLYRLRCCLVHGTPVATPLQLPTANLEYYLREAIYVVLAAFTQAKQITSLDQLFDRAQNCATRRKNTLRDKAAKPTAVNAALASSFTFQVAE